jgi:hypothetical protein
MVDEFDSSADDLNPLEPSAKVESSIPRELGDYRIIREIGRGGMGVVYEAEQVSLGRTIALKLLPAAALPDDKHVRRFKHEAKSAARLHHTNIVPVFGVGERDGLHYYVMQLIQGLPLDDVIEELKQARAEQTGNDIGSTSLADNRIPEQKQSVAVLAQSLMTRRFGETQLVDDDTVPDPSVKDDAIEERTVSNRLEGAIHPRSVLRSLQSVISVWLFGWWIGPGEAIQLLGKHRQSGLSGRRCIGICPRRGNPASRYQAFQSASRPARKDLDH